MKEERAHVHAFPKDAFTPGEMIRHAISANTLHPLLTALLLLWAEPSFPSMCNPAEPKQSVKAFVMSPRIRASLISLDTAATDLRAH